MKYLLIVLICLLMVVPLAGCTCTDEEQKQEVSPTAEQEPTPEQGPTTPPGPEVGASAEETIAGWLAAHVEADVERVAGYQVTGNRTQDLLDDYQGFLDHVDFVRIHNVRTDIVSQQGGELTLRVDWDADIHASTTVVLKNIDGRWLISDSGEDVEESKE